MRLFRYPKQLLIALGIGLIFCIVSCIVSAFTWEGELDPNEFDNNKWEVISTQRDPQGNVWMYIKNPDQDSPIKIVAIEIDRHLVLTSYRYFKYGEPYDYVLKPDIGEDGAYVRYKLTEEQRRSCIGCHKDKVGELI